MSLKRLVYRSGQFRRHLASRLAPVGLVEVRRILTPAQMELFRQMQAGEQAHSLEVFKRLEEQGETDADLQAAALLHDAGKVRFPLTIWERTWIVLVKNLFPGRFRVWGSASGKLDVLPWWQRACAVAVQHPAWGAELAQAAGCSAKTVALIRRHQEQNLRHPQSDEDRLLLKLQAVDDQS